MKKYRQLIKELPSKKVVFAFGRFQPPTNGHALLVNAVVNLARHQNADHVIYASRTHDKKSNPLPVDRKIYYLRRMFPNVNFTAANDDVRTFIEAVKVLNKTHKNLIMVAGSDRVPQYKKLLEQYNGVDYKFDTIEVISAGERDPDSDTAAGMSGTKMREAAKKGDFSSFKKGLPHTLTDHDGKRLMNEIREGLGLEPIKESVTFERDQLREMYHSGKIFNVGDKVLSDNLVCEIVKRGSNHLLIKLPNNSLSSKWLHQVKVAEDITPGDIHNKQLSYAGYTTKNFDKSEDAIKAFIDTIDRSEDKDTVLAAIKATDLYMGLNDKAITKGALNDKDKEAWFKAHQDARTYLNALGEFAHHQDYWHMHQHEIEDAANDYKEAGKEEAFGESTGDRNQMKYGSMDRIKIARVIASSLGVENVEKSSNPEQLINAALRKIRTKAMRPEYVDVIEKMLSTAKELGIDYNQKLVPQKAQAVEESEEEQPSTKKIGSSLEKDLDLLRKMKIKYHLGENNNQKKDEDEDEDDDHEMSDDEIDKMINSTDEDEFLDAYDDDELYIIDQETGEHIDTVKEEVLNEVLSRIERIRAKMRFARTQAKRERRLQIALRTRSSTSTVNKRARRMAVKLMKMRLARKPLNTLSTAEKERIERVIERRKNVINRIAMRMVPKIRRIESDRLTHRSFTK